MKMLTPCRLLLWHLFLRLSYCVVTASLCLEGSDIFASVRENSPMGQFVSDISITGEPGAKAVRLCLSGDDADWFYLDGRTIRLNTSLRVLDREGQDSVLIAELICSEDDVVQSRYRILVQVENENDNRPIFLQETIQPFTISELTALNSVVFTVKAVDVDGDMIHYSIDQSSCDAHFFRIDLPNSGSVVLNKPLDYETRSRLELIIWAQESNTVEKFNTSAALVVNIDDGDDQYPHFLPCTPVTPGVPVCMSPTYTTNITQKDQDMVLEFSPGPIRAQDGDIGINSDLIYRILSGGDHGRFVINNSSGEIRLTRPVADRQLAPFTLIIMVCQVDDILKYATASVLVRVLHENRFPPVFNKTTFKGFLIPSSNPASIVSTYGNQVLQVQVSDHDFSEGLNPNIHYSLHPPSRVYQVSQEGVLIARMDHLHAFDRHILKVVARDEESGEEVSASVDVEVLQRGQTVPRDVFTEQQLFGDVNSRLAGGVAAMILLMFLSAVLCLLLRTLKRQQSRKDPDAVGKDPERVNSSQPGSDRTFSRPYKSSSQSESFHGRCGLYTRRNSQLLPSSDIMVRNPAHRSRPVPAPPLTDSGSSCTFQTDLKLESGPETRGTPRLPDIRESTGQSTADSPLRVYDMKTNQSKGTP